MIALNVTLGQDVTKQRSSDWVGLAAKTENRHIRKHFSGLWIIAPIWGQFELMTTERSSCRRWEGHLRDHGSKVFLEERKTTQNCQLKPFSWAICSLITWPWKCSETTIESRCLSKAWLELNYWCSWETQPSKLTKWIASDIRNVKANIVTGTMGHELSDNNSINVFYQLSKAFIACKTFNSFSKLFAHITICHRLEPYFDW